MNVYEMARIEKSRENIDSWMAEAERVRNGE